MKLIVGLGNPESQYNNTRHNIGFMCINDYLKSVSTDLKKKKKGYVAEINLHGEKIVFLKPNTYMNNSGEAVIELIKFYQIDIEDMLVIYDDLDLDFGKIRIKKKSSSGGHNGIKSIINHLQTQEFTRIKVGINNSYKKEAKNFVLSVFSKEEQKNLNEVYDTVNNIIEDFCRSSDALQLMNKYN